MQQLAWEAGRDLKQLSTRTDPFMCEAGWTFPKPSPFIPFLQNQKSGLQGPDRPKIREADPWPTPTKMAFPGGV